ncbi:MAG: DUF1501 domain-containing protein [Actinomycetes bacterium]
MDTLSRRKFLQLTAGAAGSVALGLSMEDVARASTSRPLPAGTPILVIVTLYGGNDGLNTLVPYKDSTYYSLRPDIAFNESEVLPLGEGLGLNGSMTGMKTLWDQGKMAVIRGVGYPQSDHSHFRSMAIWQSGSPVSATSTGWIGRWLDTQPTDPMTAINLGSVLPPLFMGAKKNGSAVPLTGLNVPKGSLALDCQRLAKSSIQDTPLQTAASESLRNLFSTGDQISPILKTPAPESSDLPTVQGGNAGGNSALSAQLDIVAKFVAAGAPTKVWSVSLGGFDTHADEKGAQSTLIGSVSSSVSRFLSQIQSTTRKNDVTILVYSEFGRRVKANASQGTDHGTSGPVFVIGNSVKGGFYGDQPSLNSLDQGDLKVTTDFRTIYADLAEQVLMTPAERILGTWAPRFNLLGKK